MKKGLYTLIIAAGLIVFVCSAWGASEQKLEIKEILLKDLERIDRCTTCHSESDNPRFAEADQPHRSHPEPYLKEHPIEEFGCTICHRGRGDEITLKAAHGENNPWETSLLPENYLESSCAKCHPDEIPGYFKVPGSHYDYMLSAVPFLSAGRRLFDELRCRACHKVEGYQKEEPIHDLTKIGTKVKRDWLVRWLKDPHSYLPKAKCPTLGLSDQKAEAIASYLMSPTEEEVSPKVLLGEEEAFDAYDRGKIIFRTARCISCHAFNGRGGNIGPDLGKVGSKVYWGWFLRWVQNPKAYLSETRCPRYRFSGKEAIDLTEYMMSEYVDADLSEEPESGKEQKLERFDNAQIREGENLVREYGCPLCHIIKGVGQGKELGPQLTHVGSKPGGKTDLHEIKESNYSRTNWLSHKVKNHKVFKDSSMVITYNLSEGETRALTTLLLSFTNENIPEKYKIARKPASKFEPTGAFKEINQEIDCFACHTIKGQGGDLAPDLSWEGSRVKEEWLFKFLKIPDALRPILVERMPRFQFSEEEAKGLTNYIKTVLLDYRIPRQVLPEKPERLEALIEKGKELYRWYGCHACHQVGLKGGSVGPNLTEVGQRLEEGWVYVWIRDPHAFKPEVIMPNLGLSDEEAKALTAYLMSLKR